MPTPSKILICGTGAMASLFAARLVAAGIQVRMLGTWREGLDALGAYGVTLVEHGENTSRRFAVQVTRDPDDCQEASYALVLVKSWQTERAAGQLARCLAPDGVALTLQNGLGNREVLAEALGSPRVALGVTTLGATLLAPAVVRTGGDGVISVGAHARLGPLSDILRQAGFVVENAPDPMTLLWGKLVINAAINPLTALLGTPNGALLEHPAARSLLASAAREAAAVAVAQGIQLPYPDPVVAAETIARRTAQNISSMLQDIRRGAPTEIDAINGAIVRAGERLRITTPVNHTLWLLIRARAYSSSRADMASQSSSAAQEESTSQASTAPRSKAHPPAGTPTPAEGTP